MAAFPGRESLGGFSCFDGRDSRLRVLALSDAFSAQRDPFRSRTGTPDRDLAGDAGHRSGPAAPRDAAAYPGVLVALACPAALLEGRTNAAPQRGEEGTGMLEGFRDFAMKGNVLAPHGRRP